MREEEIKNVVKQGIKKPSTDFTDNLMTEINALEAEKTGSFNWGLPVLYGSCALVFLLSLFVRIPELTYLGHTIQLPAFLLPAMSSIFLLFELRQIVRIHLRVRKELSGNTI